MLICHDLRLTFGTTVVGGTRAWMHPLELIVHTASQTGLFSLAPTSRCRWKAFARPYPFDGEVFLHTSETQFLQVVTGSFVLNNPPQTTPDIHPPRHTGQTSPAAFAEKTPSGDRDSNKPANIHSFNCFSRRGTTHVALKQSLWFHYFIRESAHIRWFYCSDHAEQRSLRRTNRARSLMPVRGHRNPMLWD